MYEWGAVPKESRINYCLFSNYRIVIHWFAFILPASITANDSFLIGLLFFIIIEALICPLLYYYVVSFNDDEIARSKERVKNPDYIDQLATLGYDKLDLKLYNEYLDRRNDRAKQNKPKIIYENTSVNIVPEEQIAKNAVSRPIILPKNDTISIPSKYVPVDANQEKGLNDSENCQIALDRWKNRKKNDWDVGIEYERYVGYKLECEGYKVIFSGATQGLNDMGRDLIASKKDKTLVIQCKRWSAEKTIHEKHIFQLHGSTAELSAENPDKTYKAVFITTSELSDTAKKACRNLNITFIENFPMSDYPLIKCNFNRDGGKIYHLPFDPQYDKIVISKNTKSCYAWTVKEAEELGFRHTYNSQPNKYIKIKNVPQRITQRKDIPKIKKPIAPLKTNSMSLNSDSTAFSFIDYQNTVLILMFRTGGEYHYYNVPKHVYEELLSAPSKGKYYHENIKDQYPYY